MDKDKYFSAKNISGKKQEAVAGAATDALILFCSQEPEFEQAIEQSGKTFQECLNAVVKNVGSSISDLEVYSRAVKFYFSTAKVHFNMNIDLGDGGRHEEPPITVSHHQVSLSLDDLLDF